MIFLHHRVEALVHLDRADGDLLLHRFLQLEFFGFQHLQYLAADAGALFRRQLLGDAVERQIQRHALAQLIVGDGFVVHRGDDGIGIGLVGGGVDQCRVVVLGFLHRGLVGHWHRRLADPRAARRWGRRVGGGEHPPPWPAW